jgi:hypothetical protein
MQAAFIQKKQGRVFRVTIDPNTNMVTPTADGDIIGETYSIPKDKDGRARSSHAVGRCRDVTDANKEMWNKAIARGLVLLYARNSYFNGKEDVVRHVVIVTKIVRITDTNIVADVIDQNCDDASDTPRRCGVGYCGRENTETGRFIELVPAGDPTEPWGIFDLNSIRMMTQSEKDELANEGKK